MSLRVLALIENNIGTKLLLATRLKTLGFEITILSAPAGFRKQLEANAFDWIILDDAALPPVQRRFLEHLVRHRNDARIVWCGKSPRWTGVPIEATFEKPLRYDDIERFFSQWTSSDPGAASKSGSAIPWKPVGKGKEALHSVDERNQGAGVEITGPSGSAEGDGKA